MASAEKHALIIAIGDYPEESRWPDISSRNDVAHVEAALLQLGFVTSDISYLYDADATKAGIEQEFSKLLARVNTGDIVYIHYSGHGQQVLDDDGDEIDQLDEAIVPYDSPMLFDEGVYEGQRLLRDDHISTLTSALRKKIGPTGQLILVMDSCHSGTGTRGMGKARGTDRIMAPADFTVNIQSVEKAAGIATPGKDLAPMASYYGASPRELNYETMDEQSRPVGSLSYAISQVLSQTKSELSFRELFERVRLKMKVLAPRQNPQWEGPENTILLGGQVRKAADYFVIRKVLSSTKISIDAGTLVDIYEGATIHITNPSDGQLVTTGTVTDAGLTESVVEIMSPLADGQYYHVTASERTYPRIALTVHLSEELEEDIAVLSTVIRRLPFAKLTAANADIFVGRCEGESLQLSTKEGDALAVIAYGSEVKEAAQKQIANSLRSYAQGKYLKSLESSVIGYDFVVELVLIDCTTKQPLPSSTATSNILPVGSCVQFEVSNEGLKGAYFSLIDIQPDNVVNIIAPATYLGYTADEYFLKPGETYRTDYPIEIGQPYGEETVKLIASASPLDLSAVITTQGKATRGLANSGPLEQIFAESYGSYGTRGMSTARKTGQQLTTKTLHFKIVQ